MEPRLAHLVGLEERAAADPRDLYAAWRFFFERLAAQQLTVLVFEDLQWADAGLLDFIEYLLEWSRNSPILVVTLARPELAERRAGWGTGKRGLAALYLDPLTPDAMSQLLAGMVPGLPDELTTRILERAAGVPLYAVETVRMLLDRGLIVERDGAYRVEGSLESLEVPETLHALIAARLDSITVAERQLLQDASVVGKSFTAAGLRAITALPADAVDPCLASLVNKDLLSIQSDPRSPERGQYVFVQDLVRSVAYGTLARRDRKARHLAAAAYLESSWSDEEEVAEVVAAHLVEAYQADTDAPDAAALRDRARDALVRAGDHAASLGAGESAQHYFESALRLAGPEERATLLARAGEMAWLQIHVDDARRHLEAAVGLHTAAGRLGAAARVAVTLSAIDTHELKYGDSADRMERVFALLSGSEHAPDNEADLAVVAAECGRRLFLASRSEDLAMERLELALGIAERNGNSQVFCEAINTKGLILGGRGRREEGRALITAALDHALAADLPEAALRAYNNLAAETQGVDPARAWSYVEAGTALARLMGRRRMEVMFLSGSMPVLVDLGRWDAAIVILDELLGSHEQWISNSELSNELIMAAWVYLWRGQPSEARHLLDRFVDIVERFAPETRLVYDAVQAGVLRAEGRNAQAVTVLVDAVDRMNHVLDYLGLTRWVLNETVETAFAADDLESIRHQLDAVAGRLTPVLAPAVHALIHRFRARLAALEGRNDEVIPHAQAAIDTFQQRQMPFWLAVTRLELGEWLMQDGRRAASTALLAEARNTFVELAATPWIRRADAAAAGESATAEQTALPA